MPELDAFKLVSDFVKPFFDKPDLLKILLSILVGGGGLGIFGWIANRRQQRLKRRRYREIPSGDFPFEIIQPNSDRVLKQLMPATNEDDPLADANIPYLQRQPDRNVRQELERAFEEKSWVLILGRTGLGKTREAAQLAKVLNDEGWTILNLADKPGEWLDEPRRFPSELRPNSKLLFFLDDLNRWVYRGNPREIPKDADDPIQPLRVPVQERLLRTIAFFERECRNEVRVIATARNETDRHPDRPHEPSESEKLQFEKHPNFWKRFYCYELEEPSDEAIVQLLSDRVEAAHLRAKTDEFSQIARRNDGTFRNIIENLRTAANRESVVSVEELSETLDRTWRVRYKAAVKRYPEAQHIYDAIEVLRSLNLYLYPAMVEATAKLFVQKRDVKRFWKWLKIRQSLLYLARQDILDPRDGQIEAKGQQVDIGRYLHQILQELLKVGEKHYSQEFLVSEFTACGDALYDLKHYEAAILSLDHAIKRQPNSYELWHLRGTFLLTWALHNKTRMLMTFLMKTAEELKSQVSNPEIPETTRKIAGDFLTEFNYLKQDFLDVERTDEEVKAGMNEVKRKLTDAVFCYGKAISICPEDHRTWRQQGHALLELKNYEQAINSYDIALNINPNDVDTFYNKACCHAAMLQIQAAVINLGKAIALDCKYREMAKTNSDFDGIRNDDRFQALLNEQQNE